VTDALEMDFDIKICEQDMSEIKNIDIATLIAEYTAYDFKEVLEEKKPKSWLKSVSAFANGMGGSLFFGGDNEEDLQCDERVGDLQRGQRPGVQVVGKSVYDRDILDGV